MHLWLCACANAWLACCSAASSSVPASWASCNCASSRRLRAWARAKVVAAWSLSACSTSSTVRSPVAWPRGGFLAGGAGLQGRFQGAHLLHTGLLAQPGGVNFLGHQGLRGGQLRLGGLGLGLGFVGLGRAVAAGVQRYGQLHADQGLGVFAAGVKVAPARTGAAAAPGRRLRNRADILNFCQFVLYQSPCMVL